MRTCLEIMEWFDARWPESLACPWDNVGLLAGRAEKEVKKVYIALDATEETIEAAVSAGADMMITHHPLIFGGIKRVCDQDALGRRLLSLIKADLSCYAGHTNFDIAKGGMADLAAGRFGLFDEERGLLPLEPSGEQEGVLVGIGKVGYLKKPMSLEELAEALKERFQIPSLTVYPVLQRRLSWPGSMGMIKKAAISPGSGKSMMEAAVRAGVDVLITGDMGHHEGLDLTAEGVALVDAGHYGLEHIFVETVADRLMTEKTGLEVVQAPVSYPCKVL
ncbi:MAG: Nif3-like dinuclear metal center hexameric protein [Lachnospiraceae bacterium]|nr:Nif3-like dinuclear metal center hexameric protein [Lachnospiraceae bacterium]